MKKVIIYSIGILSLSALGLVLVPKMVDAQNLNGMGYSNGLGSGYGYRQMIETKAKLLNLSVDEIKDQLETKTMSQIAEEKGINLDELQDSIKESARQRWADRGFSEEEINNRLSRIEQRQSGDCEFNQANRGYMNRNQ